MSILFYPAVVFTIAAFLKSLDFLYLSQIKEHRLDRLKSYFLQEGIIETIYSNSLRFPAKKLRNILIVLLNLIISYYLFIFLLKLQLLNFIVATIFLPVISVVITALAVAITGIPVFIYRYMTIYRAMQKMKDSHIVSVVITGSYGKTSVKEFLYHILASKFKVAKTDKNMNSEIGVALSILKNVATDTQYLVAEAGAYRKGEIAAVCKMCRPHYGILTAIGNQHLDLFGSKKNLTEAKSELLTALPMDGKAYINLDTVDPKSIQAFLHSPKAFYSAKEKSDIAIESSQQSKGFTKATIGYGKNLITVETKLLGDHNLSNLLPCIALAFDLGMKPEEISKAVKTLSQIPGKLSQERGMNQATVLNDSNNSNVDGFIAAVHTVASLEQKIKLVVSKGIIELGKEKNASYQLIIKALQESKVLLYTTDKLFTELATDREVTLFQDENALLQALKEELNEQTALVIEGRFTEKFVSELCNSTST